MFDVLAVGDFNVGTPARSSLEGWVAAAGYDPAGIVYLSDPDQIRTANFSNYRVLYIPSNELNTRGGLTYDQNDALIDSKARIIK
jgi:hypothetical protein